ncbi:MAG: FAD-binding oxidoreductase [Parachlamydiaceae bacterium]|nr:FAD-binding oxidoreductase [Parachlamydiaceae bacterium]
MKNLILHHTLFFLISAQQIFGNVEFSTPEVDNENIEDVYLRAPNFSDENISGFNVGLRPYRKSGIRLETEIMEGKILIHNYGYGGSGLTLSLGGAHEVLSILEQEKINNPQFESTQCVAILGAGVIGLATAYELMNRGYTVNIYAENFSPNLTSNVAAGIWSPPVSENENQQKLIKKMLEISNQRFKACISSAHPEFAGVRMLTCYSFKKLGNSNVDLTNKFQESLTEKRIVRVHFDNGIIKIGKRKQELGLDGKIFMDDLYAKIVSKGAKIYSKKFSNIDDVVSLSEKIIINCTSLGSRNLFNDQDFAPVRGHLVYFQPQKGVDYMLYQNIPEDSNYWFSIYPWNDRLILGGVFENGMEKLQIDSTVTNKLIKNGKDFFKEN